MTKDNQGDYVSDLGVAFAFAIRVGGNSYQVDTKDTQDKQETATTEDLDALYEYYSENMR